MLDDYRLKHCHLRQFGDSVDPNVRVARRGSSDEPVDPNARGIDALLLRPRVSSRAEISVAEPSDHLPTNRISIRFDRKFGYVSSMVDSSVRANSKVPTPWQSLVPPSDNL